MATVEARVSTPASPVRIESRFPFEAYLKRLRSPNSRITMTRSLELVAGVLTDAPEKKGRKVAHPNSVDWSGIRHADALAVQDYLATCGRYSNSTINLAMSGLRGCMKAAWRLGMVTAEEMARTNDIPALPAGEGNANDDANMSGRRLEPGEVDAIIYHLERDRSPHGIRDFALFALMFLSAARRAEVVALTLDDLDLRAPSVTIRHGKGGRNRTVYLHHDIRRPMRRWLALRGDAPGALMVPLGRSGRLPSTLRPMTTQAVYGACQRWQRVADIDPFSPHDIRRTWVTAALESGIDTHLVQRQAGHSSPMTTAKYDRRDARAQKKAVGRLGLRQAEVN